MATGGMAGFPGEGGMVAFFAVYVLVLIAGVVAGVISLVAMWRAMRAHESIAESLKLMASRPPGVSVPLPPGGPPTG